jgi:hypothetical protein
MLRCDWRLYNDVALFCFLRLRLDLVVVLIEEREEDDEDEEEEDVSDDAPDMPRAQRVIAFSMS